MSHVSFEFDTLTIFLKIDSSTTQYKMYKIVIGSLSMFCIELLWYILVRCKRPQQFTGSTLSHLRPIIFVLYAYLSMFCLELLWYILVRCKRPQQFTGSTLSHL